VLGEEGRDRFLVVHVERALRRVEDGLEVHLRRVVQALVRPDLHELDAHVVNHGLPGGLLFRLGLAVQHLRVVAHLLGGELVATAALQDGVGATEIIRPGLRQPGRRWHLVGQVLRSGEGDLGGLRRIDGHRRVADLAHRQLRAGGLGRQRVATVGIGENCVRGSAERHLCRRQRDHGMCHRFAGCIDHLPGVGKGGGGHPKRRRRPPHHVPAAAGGTGCHLLLRNSAPRGVNARARQGPESTR
jgi:hypothetical protein